MPQAFYQLTHIPSPVSYLVVVVIVVIVFEPWAFAHANSTIRTLLLEIFLVIHYDTILNVNAMPGTALEG